MKLKFATVTTINEEGMKVTFCGEQKESPSYYKRLESYTAPAINDKVAVIQDNKNYLIIGKVK